MNSFEKMGSIQEALKKVSQDLSSAKGARALTLRIAAKRLHRMASYCNSATDTVIRLQILEGAAGLPFMSLAGKGERGWSEVAGNPVFQDIHADWFGKSKMCSVIHGVVAKEVRANSTADGGISQPEIHGKTAEDILQNIIGGCLLYTYPSPRDLSTARIPESG